MKSQLSLSYPLPSLIPPVYGEQPISNCCAWYDVERDPKCMNLPILRRTVKRRFLRPSEKSYRSHTASTTDLRRSPSGVAIGDIVRREDLNVGLDALCTTDKSPHRARFDGTTQHFVCVQDAFIVPYVVNDTETVEITTESPVSGEQIDVVITGDEVEADPSGAVMSVGVSADVSEPSVDTDSPAIAYGEICPYGHAFVDRAEYEQWAEAVDAVTMAAPLEDAFQIARAIGNTTR